MSELVSDIMWRPRAREAEFNNLTKFTKYLEEKTGESFLITIPSSFSVEKRNFLGELISFFNVQYEGSLEPVLEDNSFPLTAGLKMLN